MRRLSLKGSLRALAWGVALLGQLARPSFAQTTCDDIPGEIRSRIESAFGNKYRVKLVGVQGTRLSQNLPKTTVLFGFSEDGHAYLVMNELRLDGTLMGPSSVHRYAPLDHGLLFRFDLSLEQAEKVRQAIQGLDRHYSLTCVHTACKILEQGGVQMPVSRRESLYLTHTFKKLLEKGALNQETGQPIPVEIYSFRDSEIESLHDTLKKKEREYMAPYLIMTGSAAAATALGTVVYSVSKTHPAQAMVYIEPQPQPKE